MSDINKDKEALNKFFAFNSSNVEDPQDTLPDKFEAGYVGGDKPLAKHENYFKQHFGSSLMYLNQKGIPEWDDTTKYIKDKSIVLHNKDIYIALNSNENSPPPNNNWTLIINRDVLSRIQGDLSSVSIGAGAPAKEVHADDTYTKKINIASGSNQLKISTKNAGGRISFEREGASNQLIFITYDNKMEFSPADPVDHANYEFDLGGVTRQFTKGHFVDVFANKVDTSLVKSGNFLRLLNGDNGIQISYNRSGIPGRTAILPDKDAVNPILLSDIIEPAFTFSINAN